MGILPQSAKSTKEPGISQKGNNPNEHGQTEHSPRLNKTRLSKNQANQVTLTTPITQSTLPSLHPYRHLLLLRRKQIKPVTNNLNANLRPNLQVNNRPRVSRQGPGQDIRPSQPGHGTGHNRLHPQPHPLPPGSTRHLPHHRLTHQEEPHLPGETRTDVPAYEGLACLRTGGGRLLGRTGGQGCCLLYGMVGCQGLCPGRVSAGD